MLNNDFPRNKEIKVDNDISKLLAYMRFSHAVVTL